MAVPPDNATLGYLRVDLKDKLTMSPRWSEFDRAGIVEQGVRCQFDMNNKSIVLTVPL